MPGDRRRRQAGAQPTRRGGQRVTSVTQPPRERKSAAWWDEFWARPTAARGRALTRQRTVEETLRLLAPELGRLPAGGRLRVLDFGGAPGDLRPLFLREPRLEIVGL